MPKNETVKINKLFLIGNGFDISLGLKTKYTNFLLWLLKKYINIAINSKIDYAPFPEYKGKYDNKKEENNKIKVYGFAKNELFDVLLNNNIDYLKTKINETQDLKELHDVIKGYIEINTKTKILMSKILHDSKENWVDIENVYFEELKRIVNIDKNNNLDSIIGINNEMTSLSSYFKEYLKTIDIKINKDDSLKYFNQFNSKFEDDEFLNFKEKKIIYNNGENYFLNFNYTSSITNVLNHFPSYNYSQNFIHGCLKNEEIIFGFGDEMDSIYKDIEELNDNRFFKHIKSFHYFRSPNLRKLLSFLNSGFYQVCIYGHSCGLSDRVMLNEIFENENCKSIKIYYYNKNDFTTKTMDISRHFNNNQMMRRKIVEISDSCLIPQIKK